MNKNTKWIIGAVIVVAVIAIGYSMSGTKEPAESGPIKIGGLFALTGKWQVGGETEANFAKIAINEINQNGGIDGRPIEFILEDEKCSGKDVVSAASKLINQDNVKIILGPSCTPASGAAVPIINDAGVFMLAFTTTADNLFDKYKFAFRTSPSSKDAARFIATVANKQNINRVAIISESTEFAKNWADNFANQFISEGGNIVTNEKYITGITDFRTILTKIKTLDNIDAVYISTQTPQDAGLIIKQMSELGFLQKIKILGNPTVIDTKVVEVSGELLPADAFTVVPYSQNNELLQKYKDTYGQEPGFQFFYTAAAYDSVYMIKNAIENCGGEDSLCIRNYFLNKIKDWKGEVATWSFNKYGDPIISDQDYAVLRIVDSKKIFEQLSF